MAPAILTGIVTVSVMLLRNRFVSRAEFCAVQTAFVFVAGSVYCLKTWCMRLLPFPLISADTGVAYAGVFCALMVERAAFMQFRLVRAHKIKRVSAETTASGMCVPAYVYMSVRHMCKQKRVSDPLKLESQVV